jgi:hypothetical protein
MEIMLRLSAIGAKEVHHSEIRRGEAQIAHLGIIEPLAHTPPQCSRRQKICYGRNPSDRSVKGGVPTYLITLERALWYPRRRDSRASRKSCSNQAHDETKLRKNYKGDCYPPKRPSE